jgi:hypothetical protein
VSRLCDGNWAAAAQLELDDPPLSATPTAPHHHHRDRLPILLSVLAGLLHFHVLVALWPRVHDGGGEGVDGWIASFLLLCLDPIFVVVDSFFCDPPLFCF